MIMERYSKWLLVGVVILSRCSNKVNLLPANEVLSLQMYQNGQAVPTYTVPADNFTYAGFIAHIDSTVVDTTTTIAFVTDNGSFSTGGTTLTAKVDIHGNTYAYVKSKLAIATHVQASVGASYTQNLTVTFTTSYPDKLFLNLPDTANNKLGNRVSFTAILYKYLGSPSPGQSVEFTATDALGANIGFFENPMPSDTTGAVKSSFWLQDTTYVGFVHIRGALAISPGDSISTTSQMLITR
jgi:hypothetical protein